MSLEKSAWLESQQGKMPLAPAYLVTGPHLLICTAGREHGQGAEGMDTTGRYDASTANLCYQPAGGKTHKGTQTLLKCLIDARS